MEPWRRYQKKMCLWYKTEIKGEPIPNPNNNPKTIPDDVCLDGTGLEVKYWSKRVGRAALKREMKKGRHVIISRSGFTVDAINYAKQIHIRLLNSRLQLWHHTTRVV